MNKLEEFADQRRRHGYEGGVFRGWSDTNRQEPARESLTQEELALDREFTSRVVHRADPETITLDAYQSAACRTKPDEPPMQALAHHALGIAGEAGEIADLAKKCISHGRPLDVDSTALFFEEMGDCLWHIAALADELGVSLGECAQWNIRKLWDRFPDGFVEGGGIR